MVWYVENMKTFIIDEREVTKAIKKLEGVYGEIRVTHRKKHYYIGVDLDLTDKGKA